MNEDCANILFELAKKADVILEWGSGGSTVAMSNIIKPNTTLYSCEHDKRFYNMVKPKLNKKSKVIYMFVKPDNYIQAPPVDVHYSFILVDGIMRKECLEHARNNLSWDLLLLHDAERERYKPWMDEFKSEKYKKSFVRNLWICERIT